MAVFEEIFSGLVTANRHLSPFGGKQRAAMRYFYNQAGAGRVLSFFGGREIWGIKGKRSSSSFQSVLFS
jgi:hypothetical protein